MRHTSGTWLTSHPCPIQVKLTHLLTSLMVWFWRIQQMTSLESAIWSTTRFKGQTWMLDMSRLSLEIMLSIARWLQLKCTLGSKTGPTTIGTKQTPPATTHAFSTTSVSVVATAHLLTHTQTHRHNCLCTTSMAGKESLNQLDKCLSQAPSWLQVSSTACFDAWSTSI